MDMQLVTLEGEDEVDLPVSHDIDHHEACYQKSIFANDIYLNHGIPSFYAQLTNAF
jgi:hypothetical protein